jgi:U3 small nucleolar RNA-associated protein 21
MIIELNSGQLQRSQIESISFRTDGLGAGDDGRKAGVMATAGIGSGDVTLWDLNDGGRVMGVLRGAHNPPSVVGDRASGGINKVEFLPGQPIIVTSGLDNAIKSWIFDETPYSAVPHILHSRSGHAAPVKKLHFLPVNSDGADVSGKWLLSAGGDRSLWAWSLRRDGQSTELSQGNIQKKAKKIGLLGTAGQDATLEVLKAPEITCIATSLNRDGGIGAKAGSGKVWTNNVRDGKKGTADTSISATTGWESVITGHKDDRFARTWFWGRKKAGRWAFETSDGGEVTVCNLFHSGKYDPS